MPLLIGLELFLGYLLFFAGLHQRGRYATAPWDALKLGSPKSKQPASAGGAPAVYDDANPPRENQWA